MRYLAAMGHVGEVFEEADQENGTPGVAYAANKISRAFTTDKGAAGVKFTYVCKDFERPNLDARLFYQLDVNWQRSICK